jgi:hypothetical protein
MTLQELNEGMDCIDLAGDMGKWEWGAPVKTVMDF